MRGIWWVSTVVSSVLSLLWTPDDSSRDTVPSHWIRVEFLEERGWRKESSRLYEFLAQGGVSWSGAKDIRSERSRCASGVLPSQPMLA